MIIQTRTKISVTELSISAYDWFAYTDVEGIEIATMKVNHALKEFIEAGLTRKDVYWKMQGVFDQYSKFGFADGDSNYTLKLVLDKIYSDQE